MKRGYVKLWRKSADGDRLKNHKLWVFWCYCLMKATHKETEVSIGYQRVVLSPGQFVFGRLKAASALNMSEKTIRTCLNSLKTANQLAIKTASKFSIITIINWELYQSEDVECGHQPGHEIGQQGASKGPARGQQGATYKNVETHKHKKNVEEHFFVENSDEFRLADLLFTLLRKNNPNFKQPNIQAWASDIDKMIRIDKRPIDQIELVIAWCQEDSFWAPNIQSASKLRKQYDQLWLKMNRSCGPPNSGPGGGRPTTGSKRLDSNIQACQRFIERGQNHE